MTMWVTVVTIWCNDQQSRLSINVFVDMTLLLLNFLNLILQTLSLFMVNTGMFMNMVKENEQAFLTISQ